MLQPTLRLFPGIQIAQARQQSILKYPMGSPQVMAKVLVTVLHGIHHSVNITVALIWHDLLLPNSIHRCDWRNTYSATYAQLPITPSQVSFKTAALPLRSQTNCNLRDPCFLPQPFRCRPDGAFWCGSSTFKLVMVSLPALLP